MEINNINNNLFTKVSDINSNLFLKEANKTQTVKEDGVLNFGEVFKKQLDKVNAKQIEADVMTQKMIQGENVNIHDVMIKGEEANLSLQLAMQVRNKLVEAFQEISRTQI
ncbi:MAG: flagellar hook-basal body complex protein FliE [Sarcina sp.]